MVNLCCPLSECRKRKEFSLRPNEANPLMRPNTRGGDSPDGDSLAKRKDPRAVVLGEHSPMAKSAKRKEKGECTRS